MIVPIITRAYRWKVHVIRGKASKNNNNSAIGKCPTHDRRGTTVNGGGRSCVVTLHWLLIIFFTIVGSALLVLCSANDSYNVSDEVEFLKRNSKLWFIPDGFNCFLNNLTWKSLRALKFKVRTVASSCPYLGILYIYTLIVTLYWWRLMSFHPQAICYGLHF